MLSFCEEINYNFIYLPNSAVEFLFENYNLSCQKCKSKGKIGLICLDCGKKVFCKYEDNSVGENESNFEFFYEHVELCGGGTGAFLNTLDFNIIFVRKNKFSKNKIPLYLDKHGESIKENTIHNGFNLNDAQLKKAKIKFYNNDFIFG